MRISLAALMITNLLLLVSCQTESTSTLAYRNEAKSALLRLATNQERFYRDNGTYSNDMTKLGFATDPFVTPSGSYTIDIAPGADRGNYLLIATYNGTDAEAKRCRTFVFDGRGTRTSAPNSDCWGRK
jgi:type IV pilus assembly protein PilE